MAVQLVVNNMKRNVRRVQSDDDDDDRSVSEGSSHRDESDSSDSR